jgi:trimethylamine:corrinoid methyltransferase-like protein
MEEFRILGDSDMRQILDSIFFLMREIGVRFCRDSKVLELLDQAGCCVSLDGIVKFPTDVVKSALERVKRCARIWDRPGAQFIELSTRSTAFSAGTTCINVIDPVTCERKPSTREDLATITRIADSLSEIDGVALPCKITEKADVSGEVEEFATMVANTTKPLRYVSEKAESLKAAIDIAAAVRGGADKLREKPYFSYWVTPLPLHYPENSIDQILLAAENGVPLAIGTMSIGGASGPITIAGNLVNSLATEFAGIVLAQTAEENCFCMSSSVVAFIDPLTANVAGVPESTLAEMARGQIARSLDIPISSTLAGVCGAPHFSRDGAAVIASSMLQAVVNRAAHYDCLGTIEMGMTYSPHSLLFCNEIVGFVRRILRGIEVNAETLALDVTRQVGPGGDFLAEMHTARHCRSELWKTKYFKSMSLEQWELEGEKTLLDKINLDLLEILETHHPQLLPDSVRQKIDDIVARYGVG